MEDHLISPYCLPSPKSGNINIKTDNLSIEDGASVVSRTFGFGNSGVIDIQASESIDDMGVTIDSKQFSTIGSVTFGRGNSGNINQSTKNLSELDSGVISTTTFSSGSAGNIDINSENTKVSGLSRGNFASTTITATSFGKGNAGNISINTQTLSIKDFGSVNTTSYNSGNSGSITVNAAEFLEISGGIDIRGANINSSILILLYFFSMFPSELPAQPDFVPNYDEGQVPNYTLPDPLVFKKFFKFSTKITQMRVKE